MSVVEGGGSGGVGICGCIGLGWGGTVGLGTRFGGFGGRGGVLGLGGVTGLGLGCGGG